MSEKLNYNRRRFLGVAAMTIAAAELGMIGSADAQSGKAKPADATTAKSGLNTSFDAIKRIDAGLLNVGYAQILKAVMYILKLSN
ncbi:MAG: alpha/beta hydrolase [Mucilaginibacter sp.]|nr:alpha/beta hydrolase [Mucilaginibacter sp.]